MKLCTHYLCRLAMQLAGNVKAHCRKSVVRGLRHSSQSGSVTSDNSHAGKDAMDNYRAWAEVWLWRHRDIAQGNMHENTEIRREENDISYPLSLHRIMAGRIT